MSSGSDLWQMLLYPSGMWQCLLDPDIKQYVWHMSVCYFYPVFSTYYVKSFDVGVTMLIEKQALACLPNTFKTLHHRELVWQRSHVHISNVYHSHSDDGGRIWWIVEDINHSTFNGSLKAHSWLIKTSSLAGLWYDQQPDKSASMSTHLYFPIRVAFDCHPSSMGPYLQCEACNNSML